MAEVGSTLLASVGPGFDISLTTEDGEDVTTLAPGTYTIEVNDQSNAHNFHLSGTGVDVATEVSEVGEVDLGRRSAGRDVRVRLRPPCELDERELRSLRISVASIAGRQRCTGRAVRTRLPRA